MHWTAPAIRTAEGQAFPVRHVWCVGRNYAEHAREMGIDPSLTQPVFFAKPATSAVQTSRIDYPIGTSDLHHEVELAVFLGQGGRGLSANAWRERIWGYSVAVDLTRRDLQTRFKAAGQPWELSKGFDHSAPMGPIERSAEWAPGPDVAIELRVNGELRQCGKLGDMVWPICALLEQLSSSLTLHPGDVVLTGTPAGVGPVVRGDRVEAHIQGLPVCRFELV